MNGHVSRQRVQRGPQGMGAGIGQVPAGQQPEAQHRRRAGHQAPGLDRAARLPPRRPVDGEPAERRERPQRPVEDVTSGHLQHQVGAASVGGVEEDLAHLGGVLRAGHVDGRVGPQGQGEVAFGRGGRRRDDAAGTPHPGELHRE